MVQDALDGVPVGRYRIRSEFSPLRQWYLTGTYSVTSVSTTAVTLVIAKNELAELLLSEVEHLLDHSVEQQRACLGIVRREHWHSAAWLFVGLYYWIYFVASAYTRLLGVSLVHLDSTACTAFSTLGRGGATTATPKGGTYVMTGGADVSATHRTAVLRKQRLHTHEALWARVNELLTRYEGLASGRPNSEELAVLRSLRAPLSKFGAGWASDLRNAVNYRSGFGFGAVRSQDRLASKKSISGASTRHLLDAALELNALTDSIRPVSLESMSSGDLKNSIKCVALFGALLQPMVHALFLDLSSRVRIVGTREAARISFLNVEDLSFDAPFCQS